MNSLLTLTLARLRLSIREPGAIFWTFGFPILVSLALGIAFRNRPPEPVRVAVVAGAEASGVTSALRADKRLDVSELASAEAEKALRVGRVELVVLPGEVRTYELDPTRPESRLARLVVDDVLQRAAGRVDAAAVADHPVTEPGGRYIDFLVPGIIGLNIMSSGMWGIAYVIVETRTKKLLKRMLATPMSRGHFLLSFVLMRMAFLAVELPVLLGFSYFAFGVVVRGSLGLFALLATLGALAFSGVGVLVASRAQNTQTVTGLINLIMMPMFIGSGVFFSVARFPEIVQPALRALPLTALNDAMRAVMNEGAGLFEVAPQALLLAGIAVASFVAGLKVFRWA